MKNLLLITTLLLGMNVIAQSSEVEDKTAFFIDDIPIKQSTLAQYHNLKGYKRPADAEQERAQQMQSAQELINIYLLSAEAEKNGLHNNYDVKQSLELSRRNILMKAMAEKYAAEIEVSENELEEAYATINKNAVLKADFKIRNIIVEQQKTAEEIISKLKSGDSFEQLEKEYSPEGFKEPKTLEWMNSSLVQPEIAAALKSLKISEFTHEPVKTRFGWHVIFLADKKTIPVPALDTIRDDLAGLIKKKKLSEKVGNLRAKVTVKAADKAK
ncbi:MAG: hypothetical protein HKP55_02070 [Gammaproteobacteria bacterium]|nr:hypothetical protein [Gammaproteobacteria bacterium]